MKDGRFYPSFFLQFMSECKNEILVRIDQVWQSCPKNAVYFLMQSTVCNSNWQISNSFKHTQYEIAIRQSAIPHKGSWSILATICLKTHNVSYLTTYACCENDWDNIHKNFLVFTVHLLCHVDLGSVTSMLVLSSEPIFSAFTKHQYSPDPFNTLRKTVQPLWAIN